MARTFSPNPILEQFPAYVELVAKFTDAYDREEELRQAIDTIQARNQVKLAEHKQACATTLESVPEPVLEKTGHLETRLGNIQFSEIPGLAGQLTKFYGKAREELETLWQEERPVLAERAAATPVRELSEVCTELQAWASALSNTLSLGASGTQFHPLPTVTPELCLQLVNGIDIFQTIPVTRIQHDPEITRFTREDEARMIHPIK